MNHVDVHEKQMKVDVVLLTKNSADCVFDKCLASVKRNIPVHDLIVVDAFSIDATLDMVRKYFSDAKVIFDKGTRATARQKGMEAVTTEWFVFIDSDVILNDGWFMYASLFMKDKSVGAFQGREMPLFSEITKEWNEAMDVLRGKFPFFKKKSRMLKRGFTGDTLVRTALVKDIKIPPFLHIYEDNYIKRFVESKGFKWIISDNVISEHWGRPYKGYDVIIAGCLGYREGYLDLRNTLFATLTAFPKGIFAWLLKRNIHLFFHIIRWQILTLIGVLKGQIIWTERRT